MQIFLLKFHWFGIGDQVSCTAIPENIFNFTGSYSAVVDELIWAFKHNPYVKKFDSDIIDKATRIDVIPDTRIKEQVEKFHKVRNSICSNGQTDFIFTVMDAPNIKLRHPRLYIYEDIEIDPNRIIVHTTGSDRSKVGEEVIRSSNGEDELRILSDDVIRVILKNYKDYDIIQVGALNDKPLGGKSKNLSGKLSYWETAKLIAGASKFIGVNSGPMHIANCYPRVEKKIILQEFPMQTLQKYVPGDIRNYLFSWLDPTNKYFNKFDYDVGFTYSYKKI